MQNHLYGKIHLMDAIEGLQLLDAESVDLIFCDLPYGTTHNAWDSIISPTALWEQYGRIIKPNGVIVLTATFRFAVELLEHATVPFRYDLVWHKNRSTGFLNANRQPLRQHENLLVFYKKAPAYHPQKTDGHKPMNAATKKANAGTTYGRTKTTTNDARSTERYPTSILAIPTVNMDDPERIHPSQKPVELVEWVLRSYTNPGDVVVDNCMGAGTTAIACLKNNRQFVGFEDWEEMFDKANQRIARYQEQQLGH